MQGKNQYGKVCIIFLSSRLMHILAIEEYGLRCLLQVAFHEPSRPMTVQEIARAEGLGPEYVAKIMRTLRADPWR